MEKGRRGKGCGLARGDGRIALAIAATAVVAVRTTPAALSPVVPGKGKPGVAGVSLTLRRGTILALVGGSYDDLLHAGGTCAELLELSHDR